MPTPNQLTPSDINKAIQDSNLSVIDELVKKGKPDNYKDNLGNTPFLMAVIHNNLEGLKLLKDHSNINAQNNQGQSALHIAIANRNFQIIVWLFEQNINVKLEDKNQETALFIATRLNMLAVCHEILQRADILNKKNKALMTAVDVAIQLTLTNITNYFSKRSQKPKQQIKTLSICHPSFLHLRKLILEKVTEPKQQVLMFDALDNLLTQNETDKILIAKFNAVMQQLQEQKPRHCMFWGDPAVGKSTFVHRLRYGVYEECLVATIGVDKETISRTVNNISHEVNIWDTSGIERFRPIVSSYFRGTQFVFLFYDITDIVSFNLLTQKLDQEVLNYTKDEIYFVLIGTKTDLESKRIVPIEDAKQFANQIGAITHFECSIKKDKNLKNKFFTLVDQFLNGEFFIESLRQHVEKLNAVVIVQKNNENIPDDVQEVKEVKNGNILENSQEIKEVKKKQIPTQLKCVFFGESRIGKSTIIHRLKTQRFASVWGTSTTEIEKINRTIHDKVEEVTIVDVEDRKYRTNIKCYFEGTSFIFLFYDITNRHSFTILKRDLETIKKHLKEYHKLILVGTKSDLDNKRQILFDEATLFAKEISAMEHFECSAKTGENIENKFFEIMDSFFPDKVLHDENSEKQNDNNANSTNVQQQIVSDSNVNSSVGLSTDFVARLERSLNFTDAAEVVFSEEIELELKRIEIRKPENSRECLDRIQIRFENLMFGCKNIDSDLIETTLTGKCDEIAGGLEKAGKFAVLLLPILGHYVDIPAEVGANFLRSLDQKQQTNLLKNIALFATLKETQKLCARFAILIVETIEEQLKALMTKEQKEHFLEQQKNKSIFSSAKLNLIESVQKVQEKILKKSILSQGQLLAEFVFSRVVDCLLSGELTKFEELEEKLFNSMFEPISIQEKVSHFFLEKLTDDQMLVTYLHKKWFIPDIFLKAGAKTDTAFYIGPNSEPGMFGYIKIGDERAQYLLQIGWQLQISIAQDVVKPLTNATQNSTVTQTYQVTTQLLMTAKKESSNSNENNASLKEQFELMQQQMKEMQLQNQKLEKELAKVKRQTSQGEVDVDIASADQKQMFMRKAAQTNANRYSRTATPENLDQVFGRLETLEKLVFIMADKSGLSENKDAVGPSQEETEEQRQELFSMDSSLT